MRAHDTHANFSRRCAQPLTSIPNSYSPIAIGLLPISPAPNPDPLSINPFSSRQLGGKTMLLAMDRAVEGLRGLEEFESAVARHRQALPLDGGPLLGGH